MSNHSETNNEDDDSLDHSFHEPVGKFKALLSKWEQGHDEPNPPGASVVFSSKDGDANLNLLTRRFHRVQARESFQAAFQNSNDNMSFADSVSTCSTVKKAMRQPKNVYQKPLITPKDYKPPTFNHPKDDQELILKSLKKCLVFKDRTMEELTNLVTVFEKVSYRKDTIFIREGEPADYFYILKSGSVKFLVHNQVVDKVSRKGTMFGELALLYACPRAATVMTGKDARLFRISSAAYRAVLQSQTQTEGEKKVKLLQGVPFLRPLTDEDRKRLSGVMLARPFETGEVLIKKGAPHGFWILQEGEVNLTDVKNRTLQPGHYFGERALAGDQFSDVDVVATTKGVAYTIDRVQFEKVLGSMSSCFAKAQDAKTLETISFIRKAGLDALQLATLASLISEERHPTGKVIIKRGSKVKPVLYFVRSGVVEVEHSDGRKELIKAGGFFAEELMRSPDSKHQLTVNSPFTARVVESCVCGLLTLRDCRSVFDTDIITTDMDETKSEQSDDTPEQAAPKQKDSKARKSKTVVVVPRDQKDLTRHVLLGEGTFGQVWLVTNKKTKAHKTPRPFALKIQVKEELLSEGQVGAAVREKNIMGKLRHPFINRLFRTYQDDDFLYSVVDFIQGGELFSVMNCDEEGKIKVPEAQVQFYGLGIADALAYMHRKKIVYRDLKPENVMIDGQGYPIIIDFGFAKKVVDKTFTLCGTPGYLAPEVIMSRGHDCSADHWSLGVLIYEMLLGENPFYYEGMDQMRLFTSIVEEKHEIPKDMNKDAVDLIDGLLTKNPVLRLGSLVRGESEILQHPWFQPLELQAMRRREATAPWIPPIKDPLDCSCFDDWSETIDKTTQKYTKLSEQQNKEFEDF